MNNSKQSRPPFYTASIGLFIQTIFALSIIAAVYIWYLPDTGTINNDKPKQKILNISTKHNLIQIFKDMKDYTTLIFEAGKYQQNLVIENLKGIVLQAAENQEVVFQAVEGIAIDWRECSNGEMRGIKIIAQDAKSPAINFVHCQNILLEDVSLDSTEIALRSRFDCKDIRICGNLPISSNAKDALPSNVATIKGQVIVQKCQNFTLRDYVWKGSNTSYAGIFEEISNLQLENNHIVSEQGLQLKKIQSLETAQSILRKNKITANKDGLFILDYSSYLILEGNKIATKIGPSLAIIKSNYITLGNERSQQMIESELGQAMLISQGSNINVTNCWYKNRDTKSHSVAITMGSENISFLQNQISGLHYIENIPTPESQGSGVLIQGSTKIIFAKNQISESVNMGVRVENKSQVHFIANIIQENSTNGIEIEDSNIELGSQNSIYQNGSAGIVMKSSNGALSDNRICNNHDSGIILENSSPNLENNKIQNNGSHGIVLRQNSLPSVKRNEISDNKGFGISFGKQLQKIEWRDNVFSKNREGESDDTSVKYDYTPPSIPIPNSTKTENIKENSNKTNIINIPNSTQEEKNSENSSNPPTSPNPSNSKNAIDPLEMIRRLEQGKNKD